MLWRRKYANRNFSFSLIFMSLHVFTLRFSKSPRVAGNQWPFKSHGTWVWVQEWVNMWRTQPKINKGLPLNPEIPSQICWGGRGRWPGSGRVSHGAADGTQSGPSQNSHLRRDGSLQARTPLMMEHKERGTEFGAREKHGRWQVLLACNHRPNLFGIIKSWFSPTT